jgi:lipoprotein Spr
MKLFYQYSLALLLLIGFGSCKSFKSATIQSNTQAAKNKSPQFIDGIEITPGHAVSSKHDIKNAKQKSEVSISKVKPDAALMGNIEKADFLQLKYAIMLDATVERLTNIALLQKMEEWWGTKYCLGGSTKNCIDCSAFTQTIYKEIYNTSLPRTAQEQYNIAEKIETDDLKEGDLVFFGTSEKRITHVGIYVINNKFFNASTSSGVTINDLNENYWKQRYRSAGRVLK